MTDEQHHPEGGDPEIGRLLTCAYRTPVDVETASRHLWRLNQVARRREVRRARRTLVSTLAAVLLFATTGTAVALSGQAVPGDSLYPVKRGAERVHLLVSFAPDSDARLHLRFARSRVAEAEQVAASRPDTVPGLASEAVRSVSRARAAGARDLSDEIDLVRREASTALASLDAALDDAVLRPELAQSFDAAVRALDGAVPAPDTATGDPGAADDVTATDDPGAGEGGVAVDAAEGTGDATHSEPEDGAGEAGTPTSRDAGLTESGMARPQAPDRALPPQGGGQSHDGDEGPAVAGGEGDGGEGAGADAEAPEVSADPEQVEEPAAPPPAAPTAAPETGAVATDATMSKLERLEGLVRETP